MCSSARSLAQLSAWCRGRLGDHQVEPVLDVRQFDIPWMVLDASRARETWDWAPSRTTEDILEEILAHAADASRLARRFAATDSAMPKAARPDPTLPPLDKLDRRHSGPRRGGLHRLDGGAPAPGAAPQDVRHEIVVVDDGSTDRRGQILAGSAGRVPDAGARPEHRARTASAAPSSYGLNSMTGDAVVIMMADESDDCRDVVRYWRLLNEGWECVFGSRFVAGRRRRSTTRGSSCCSTAW